MFVGLVVRASELVEKAWFSVWVQSGSVGVFGVWYRNDCFFSGIVDLCVRFHDIGGDCSGAKE